MTITRSYLIVSLCVVLLGFSAVKGFSCSLADGYLKPSNYDLVKETTAIVLAKAVSVDRTPPPGTRFFQPRITFRIIQTLKGNYPGQTLVDSGIEQYLGGGSENDFLAVRKGADTGACNAYDYAVGKQFLLFLNKSGTNWKVSGPPFSRINEEVSDANSPWVVAVREYVRISELKNNEQEKSELRNLQKATRTDRRSYPAGLDRDIDSYFERPYSTKSYQDLMDLYSKATTTQQRGQILWAFAQGKHKEAHSLMQSLMRSADFTNHIGPITAYVEATKDYSSVPVLGEAYLGIRNKQTRWPIMWSLIRLAGQRDSALMLAVLKSADIEEAGRLSSWFVRYPNEEATQIFQRLAGSQYEERFDLTISLAALRDAAVVEWARSTIAQTNNRQDKRVEFRNSSLKRGLALLVLTSSPLPEADALAKDILLKNDSEDIADLAEGYLSSPTPIRWDRLREIPDLKAIDQVHDHWIQRTLVSMAAENDQNAMDLLRRLN